MNKHIEIALCPNKMPLAELRLAFGVIALSTTFEIRWRIVREMDERNRKHSQPSLANIAKVVILNKMLT